MNQANIKFVTKQAEQLRSILEHLQLKQEDLQETFDSASEKWQESEKGEKWQEELSSLEDAINNLEAAVTSLEEIAQYE
jgi:chromosome segregation ATPase